MINKAILVGRCGADPDSKFTSGGQQVCNLRIATTEKFKNRAGEKQEVTEWHRLVFWGKLAEIVQQYVKKGQLIYVEGKITTRQWEKDGIKRYSTDIVVRDMKMLTPKGDGQRSAPADDAEPDFAPQTPGTSSDSEGTGPEISDEDIPF